MPGAIWGSTAFICPIYGPHNSKSVNSTIMLPAGPERRLLATIELGEPIEGEQAGKGCGNRLGDFVVYIRRNVDLASAHHLRLVARCAWAAMAGDNKIGLGRLPGDIVIERDNLRVYIPLATSL